MPNTSPSCGSNSASLLKSIDDDAGLAASPAGASVFSSGRPTAFFVKNQLLKTTITLSSHHFLVSAGKSAYMHSCDRIPLRSSVDLQSEPRLRPCPLRAYCSSIPCQSQRTSRRHGGQDIMMIFPVCYLWPFLYLLLCLDRASALLTFDGIAGPHQL